MVMTSVHTIKHMTVIENLKLLSMVITTYLDTKINVSIIKWFLNNENIAVSSRTIERDIYHIIPIINHCIYQE